MGKRKHRVGFNPDEKKSRARKAQVLRLVLREGATLISVGTVLGFLGAFALSKIMATLTNAFVDALKVGTNDPRLLVGAPLLLAGLALLACYIPARRAAKIDPLNALREGQGNVTPTNARADSSYSLRFPGRAKARLMSRLCPTNINSF